MTKLTNSSKTFEAEIKQIQIPQLALNQGIRRLWEASKIFGVPLYDPILKGLNQYDLELMDYLQYFEDPENVKYYQNKFTDDDFNDYWDSEEYQPANPNKKDNDEWVDIENGE